MEKDLKKGREFDAIWCNFLNSPSIEGVAALADGVVS